MRAPIAFAVFTLTCFAVLLGGMIKVSNTLPEQESAFKRLKDAGCYDENLEFQATDLCCELAPWFNKEVQP